MMLELVGALLGDEATARGRLAAAYAYIAAHLSDQDLSASRTAAAVGYSERQLSRVFADSGQSVPQAVLAARPPAPWPPSPAPTWSSASAAAPRPGWRKRSP